MFFVVRSNDIFNFPLGLIKCIVFVIVVSVYAGESESVCVCCTYLLSFFPLVFVWLIIVFSLVSRNFCSFLFALEMRTILLLLLFVQSFCCMHLHFIFIAVSNHCEICQMFFH